ncbi:MAG: tRNA 2-thiouridine(34) synthase MnmA [Clostridia bacterium]|nr:tRNA 2-thiouridine(34) synthase MnmA [Clostridia bacterium]
MAIKVMVAMSGGVDSSVAAALLKDEGFEVIGATLKLFSNEEIGLEHQARTCCSLEDVEDARAVAMRLGFVHHVFNFGELFRQQVINRFAASYANGETPNPCIDCNRFIKFDKLLERALVLDMDYIATGHYARVEFSEERGRYLLKKAADPSKDQSYVLYALTQEQLKHTLFPLGNLKKSEVRAIAESRGLVNAKKPDSQDICFVKDGDYCSFLENTMKVSSPHGNFVDSKGNVLGEHEGLIHYTIGQRKGLKLSFEKPKYVIRKDLGSNTVVLGDESELYSEGMLVKDVNLISVEELSAPMKASVKTRYSQKEAPAVLIPLEDGSLLVRFFEPQRAVTSGQAAVFYDDDTVIGGGTIVHTPSQREDLL